MADELEGQWKHDKKLNAKLAKVDKSEKGKVKRAAVVLVLPETFMNLSGKAIAPLIKSAKAAEKLVVVHDDIDLPFGTMKLVFDRGDGGHNGVASIIKAIKTRAFVRVRIGVAPTSASGKTKKPSGEEAVIKFILGKFTPSQDKENKKIIKRAAEACLAVVTDGRERAMNVYNQSV